MDALQGIMGLTTGMLGSMEQGETNKRMKTRWMLMCSWCPSTSRSVSVFFGCPSRLIRAINTISRRLPPVSSSQLSTGGGEVLSSTHSGLILPTPA